MNRRAPTPLEKTLAAFDPGWLFLIAGMAALAACVLIPAHDDLNEARFIRSQASAVEAHHARRLERYAGYLDALTRGDEYVARSLISLQLNTFPEGRARLRLVGEPMRADANVLATLEPPPIHLRAHRDPPPSLLARLTIGDRSRLWLMGAGAFAVMIGLLPPTQRRRAPA